MEVSFETLAVIGLGLLGGSVAGAARERGVVGRVVGVSRRPEMAAAAVDRGLCDEAGTDLAAGLREADLVILATPVYAMEETLRGAAAHLREGCLVTDVGSVKGVLADTLPGLLPPAVRYVGSHPMAGSHASGLAFARADLFEGAACVVTPRGADDAEDAQRLAGFWRALGSRVELRDPARHDDEVAWVSHLPHAVAFAFARALASAGASAAALKGSGFRDFTRVARSEPEMWADILVTNRKALAGPLQEALRALQELARRIESGDLDAVSAELSAARDLLATREWETSGPDEPRSGNSIPDGADDARSGGANPEIQAAPEAATKE